MGHNPATRDVKNSERKQAVEKRTPDEIIKGIRGNLAAHLSITPSDIALLLKSYDAMVAGVIRLQEASDTYQAELKAAAAKIADQQEKLVHFRDVYEQENRRSEIAISPEGVAQLKQEIQTGRPAGSVPEDGGVQAHIELGGEA